MCSLGVLEDGVYLLQKDLTGVAAKCRQGFQEVSGNTQFVNLLRSESYATQVALT